jgi:hypothetical protein
MLYGLVCMTLKIIKEPQSCDLSFLFKAEDFATVLL